MDDELFEYPISDAKVTFDSELFEYLISDAKITFDPELVFVPPALMNDLIALFEKKCIPEEVSDG